MPAEASYDCQACGACCAEFDVLLDDGEADRLSQLPRPHKLVVQHPLSSGQQLQFLRRDGLTARCVALAGPLGACRCVIYPHRPHLCREFEAGSDQCLAARRAHGFTVQDSEEEAPR